jgi:hypothetical protein
MNLLLQKQSISGTCVQTCIAMALGVPEAKVIDRFGGEPMNQQTLESALTQCGVRWNRLLMGDFIYEGWYFACVPSLNKRGGNHQVLIRWITGEGLTVLDPAIGNTYSKNGSDLVSWNDLTPFIPGGKLPL